MSLHNIISYTLTIFITLNSHSVFATGSRILATGGVTGFEGSAGGGITPWALISGYGSREEIRTTANIQTLNTQEYQLNTFGASVGFYDHVEFSIQKQNLAISSGVVSNVFNLLTAGQITTAPGTHIEQEIIGVKVKLFGDAVFSEQQWIPQLSIGVQHKRNLNFIDSLSQSNGDVPLPGQGVPRLLGATDDKGTDIYLSASKLFLGAAWGNNILLNATARLTKSNTFGLLGFGSSTHQDYELEWEGSFALFSSANTAIGAEFRTQSNRLNGLASEKTVKDVFIAYFPDKSWSMTAAYVELGNLPFESDPSGFYFTITVNL